MMTNDDIQQDLFNILFINYTFRDKESNEIAKKVIRKFEDLFIECSQIENILHDITYDI
jgi:hypothetical protein